MLRPANLIVPIVLLLSVSLGVEQFTPVFLPSIPKAHAASITIVLVGQVAGWNFTTNNNPTITVSQGDLVTFKLSSSDGAPHWFIVDTDGDGSATDDCPSVDPCSSSFATDTIYPLNVMLPAGTYTYYCVIHPSTMFGKFVVLPVPFDYAISLAPSRTSIVQGQNTTVIVRSSLVSGIAENVSLSTAVSPDPSFRIVLNTTSGFPSFSVTMLIATGSSSQIGTYTVTVMGMSSSGVARNATFTLTLTSRPPATPQTPNYAVFAGIGAVVVASVLLVFLVPRRLRNKKP